VGLVETRRAGLQETALRVVHTAAAQAGWAAVIDHLAVAVVAVSLVAAEGKEQARLQALAAAAAVVHS